MSVFEGKGMDGVAADKGTIDFRQQRAGIDEDRNEGHYSSISDNSFLHLL
jgi:hypothetical protein